MNKVDSVSISSNIFWRLLERCGAQGVNFIVSIVLARILVPSAYGTIALINVFINILQVFVDAGLGNALIQKKGADDLDFSSVFFFNIVFCLLLYCISFAVAPFIAQYYKNQQLIKVIRVLSLTVVISGVKNVQQAYISKNMMFKIFFYSTSGGTIGAAVLGLFLAYHGYGVWALVIQHLFNNFVDTLVMWFVVKWKPKLKFSFERLKGLLLFGYRLLFARLIEVMYVELHSLIIGKKYNTSDLAYYNKGESFSKIIVSNIDSSLTSVLFSALSVVQDNHKKLKEIVLNSLKLNCYLTWPCMMGLAVCAKPLVSILLTNKWMFCVPYIRVFCFVYACAPFNTTNMNLFRACGDSKLYLRIETIRKIFGLIVLLTSMWFGPFCIAIGEIVNVLFMVVITSHPSEKIIDLGFLKQAKSLSGILILNLIMGILVYALSYLKLENVYILLLQVLIGIVCYILISYVFKVKQFTQVCNVLKKIIKK